MLILSRKQSETIRIDDNITLIVVDMRYDKVRIGIEAPKSVPVHRGEVYAAIQRAGGRPTVSQERQLLKELLELVECLRAFYDNGASFVEELVAQLNKVLSLQGHPDQARWDGEQIRIEKLVDA